jgi:hypothetical protein
MFSVPVLAVLAAPEARAGLITQSATIPFTTTNFGPDSDNVPQLTFQKFDDQGGSLVLDSVELSVNAAIRSNFDIIFTTPATITTSIMSNGGGQPGPSLTIYQPDGFHSLLTVTAPSDPASLTRSVTYGFQPGQSVPQEFSSTHPTDSPWYIQPAYSQGTNSMTLTAPSDLAVFTGSGSLMLPAMASANSRITMSSGNGYGGISTEGTAGVTVTYNYHSRVPAPETVPEPAACLLWGLGGLVLVAARRAAARG